MGSGSNKPELWRDADLLWDREELPQSVIHIEQQGLLKLIQVDNKRCKASVPGCCVKVTALDGSSFLVQKQGRVNELRGTW